MAYELSWNLLGPPVNVGEAVQAGFQHGRAMRQQSQQERAFQLLAQDPNSAEGQALLVQSGHPDQARQFHEWGKEDTADAFRRNILGGGPAPGAAFSGQTAPAAAPSAFGTANAPTAPATGLPGAVPALAAPGQPTAASGAPAAATAPGQLNPQLMRQFFAVDPQGAQQLQAAWNGFNNAQRAQESQRYAAAVPVLSAVAALPLAERAAAVQAQSGYLIQNGWTAEQLQHFAADPSDQNINMLLHIGVPLAEQHTFFAPLEGAPGAVYRDPITLGVTAANPTQPHTEIRYDSAGNQIPVTMPGTPAIGPGADRFGPSSAPSASGIEPGAVVNGFRYRGPPAALDSPERRNPANWERVAEGGAGQPNASGTFP